MKYPAIISLFFLFSCLDKNEVTQLKHKYSDLFSNKVSSDSTAVSTTVDPPENYRTKPSATTATRRDEVLKFAYQYLGTPYVYGSADPKTGFDCSGFINYVYRHFGYEVPRSSKDFLHFGREIPLENVRKGDLLIFYGTDIELREIGHIGIVSRADAGNSEFIHASSGKANGVTVSSLSSPHYTARFVKAISVLD
ncbi:MAG: C40 family peptidase [Weeksellaceae bacterium]|nr:C40 family peptidase [Bacteroidota bacterium]MCG2780127.1 C40 family peptidase [Weeksellaceae bacterium]